MSELFLGHKKQQRRRERMTPTTNPPRKQRPMTRPRVRRLLSGSSGSTTSGVIVGVEVGERAKEGLGVAVGRVGGEGSTEEETEY